MAFKRCTGGGGSTACFTPHPTHTHTDTHPCTHAPAGDDKTDVSTSEDGTKRIITKTGVYSGTELHLWHVPPHYDPRLPPAPGRPDLTFDAPRRAVTTDAEWRALAAAQPVCASSRRRAALRFLHAKLAAPSEALQLEGGAGVWELAINKEHHADLMDEEALGALVERLGSPNIEVRRGARELTPACDPRSPQLPAHEFKPMPDPEVIPAACLQGALDRRLHLIACRGQCV